MIEYLDCNEKIENFFGFTPIISASVKVTRRCNLNCRHCYVHSKSSERDMDIDDFVEIIEKLRKNGLQKLYLNGGEPFLNQDIFRFFEYAKDQKLITSCSSNGSAIMKSGLERLALYKPRLFQVSIDGVEDVHNYIRKNSNSYKNAVNCLKKAKEKFDEDTQLVMAFTLMGENKEYLVNMLELAKEISVDTFCIVPLMPSSEKKFLANDLSAKEQKWWIQMCVDEYVKEYSTDFELSLIVPPGLVPPEIKKRKYGKGYLCSFPSMLGIDVDGTVAPCDGLLDDKNFIIGNIFNDSLASIMSSTVYQQLINLDYTKLTGVCSKCTFLEICQGGCRVAAYNKYGSFYASDPICQQYYEAGIFPKENLKNEKS